MATAATNGRDVKTQQDPALIARMEQAGPSKAKLRKLPKKRRPPQSWYEQTDCPFKPAKE
jgi:hypothetical protein